MSFEDTLRRKQKQAKEAEAARLEFCRGLSVSDLSKAVKSGIVDSALDREEGRDKKVFIDPVDPQKVYKVYREQSTARDANQFRGIERRSIENQSKVNFYLQKILHALFPKNIPNRSASGTKPKFTHDQRIRYRAYQYHLTRSDEGHIPPEVRDLIDTLGVLGVSVDKAPQNFGKDEAGNVVYIDDLHMSDETISKIEAWVASRDEAERRYVERMLERLRYWAQK